MSSFALIFYGAHWFRFEGDVPPEQFRHCTSMIGLIVVLKLFVFVWFGVCRNWNRIFSFHDLLSLVRASTFGTLILAGVDCLVFPTVNMPRSVFIMDWGGTIGLLAGLRAIMRLQQEGLLEPLSKPESDRPVLIVGTSTAAEILLRIIRRSAQLPYRVVGFLSEDPEAVGTQFDGVPVLGIIERTVEIAVRHNLREVLVTRGELPGKKLRQLVDAGEAHDVDIRIVPSQEELIEGNVDLTPKRVCIEDLLQREPIKLDQWKLRRWLDGRTLMVTGSAGSIGSEICRQLLKFEPRRLVMVDRWESGQFFLERELRRLAPQHTIDVCLADVSDQARMASLLAEYRPNVLFHAAAYKHVPLMEENPGEAVKNIVLLTQGLADLAVDHGVSSFVMISTDKAVNPTNVMGASKRVAELYVQSRADDCDCRFVTVRFGNVLDSAGSVVPIFRQQIAEGGPVTVTHPDVTRYFMTIPEASQLVIQAGAMGQGGEIFVLDMGSPVRIYEMARDMIRLSGLKEGEDIEIEVVGLRPGEKLYEELHVEGERHVATSHPKITVAESHEINRLEILRSVKRLRNLADGPAEFIYEELRNVVPQFQHTQFEHGQQRRAA